jgi:hypothetical protein
MLISLTASVSKSGSLQAAVPIQHFLKEIDLK